MIHLINLLIKIIIRIIATVIFLPTAASCIVLSLFMWDIHFMNSAEDMMNDHIWIKKVNKPVNK